MGTDHEERVLEGLAAAFKSRFPRPSGISPGGTEAGLARIVVKEDGTLDWVDYSQIFESPFQMAAYFIPSALTYVLSRRSGFEEVMRKAVAFVVLYFDAFRAQGLWPQLEQSLSRLYGNEVSRFVFDSAAGSSGLPTPMLIAHAVRRSARDNLIDSAFEANRMLRIAGGVVSPIDMEWVFDQMSLMPPLPQKSAHFLDVLLMASGYAPIGVGWHKSASVKTRLADHGTMRLHWVVAEPLFLSSCPSYYIDAVFDLVSAG